MSPPAPVPVVFDSDGCIVACDALWWGLTASTVDVVAVTAAPGVVNARQGAENFARVLEAADRVDVPLAVGAEERLGPAPKIAPATLVHGEDGLGNTCRPRPSLAPAREPAHELIARLAAERPRELTLVSTGPFGNVARALRHRPELAAEYASVVIQGMAARPPGNATAVANFNMAYDPTAGAELVAAPWPFRPVMVGMDVTYRALLTDAEFAVLEQAHTPHSRFMIEPWAYYRAHAPSSVPGQFPSMDTLCFMTVAHPELVSWEELPVEVDNAGGPAWGMTVVDLRYRMPPVDDRPHWRVALDVDVERFRALVREFWSGEMMR